MLTENFLPKKAGINGYGSGQAGWSGVDLKISPREGLYVVLIISETATPDSYKIKSYRYLDPIQYTTYKSHA